MYVLNCTLAAIICISCSKVFDMPDELRIHKKLVHDTDSPVLCDFCKDKPIMPRSEIRTHFKEHHSSRYFKYFPRIRITRAIGSGEPTTYKCKYCWNIFTTAFELEDHVKTHIFKCPFCSKNFSRIRTYYNHVKRLHNCSASSYPPTPFVVYGPDAEDEKPIYCKACNKTYLRLGSYNRHIKQKHRKRSLTHETDKIDLDKVQEKTIDDLQPVELLSSQLQIESIFHSPEQSQVYVEKLPEIISEEKLSEYQHCPNKIEETYDVTHTDAGEYTEQLQELDYDPNEDEMTCTVLGEEENLNKSFERQKKSIIRKKANRSKQKKKNEYLCSFCPQVLSSRTTLEMHENIKHLNVKTQEECPICKKKLKPSYISTHIQMVHNEERNYVCDICEDSYKTKNQLKRHKMLHDKDSGLPCTVCDKKFTERADLNVHMRLHTGELPYACHICDRRFRIKVRLTYHLQHHANIKKKCKICDKEFKNGTSLRKHSYEHTGNFPYTCTNCDYRHVNREYFCKHMLNKHGKVMSADELFAMFKANTGRNPYVKKAEDLENMNINS
uniref:Zinc finger protein 600 n=1 Tax=Ceratitis capitata TaxID=7213 RepID=W8CBW6_CERCA